MAKISAIYRAPKGDSKVCELFGFTFFDGKAVEIEDTPQNAHAIAKLSRNKCFEVAEEGTAHTETYTPPEPEEQAEEEQTRGRRHR